MRACNYNAPTGDSRLAIKTLLLNLPRRRRRLRTPSPRLSLHHRGPLHPRELRWRVGLRPAFFLFLYEDRDVSKDSGVVFVSTARLRHSKASAPTAAAFLSIIERQVRPRYLDFCNPLTKSAFGLSTNFCLRKCYSICYIIYLRTSFLCIINIIAVI